MQKSKCCLLIVFLILILTLTLGTCFFYFRPKNDIEIIEGKEYLNFLAEKINKTNGPIKVIMFNVWFNFSDPSMKNFENILKSNSNRIKIIVDDGNYLGKSEMRKRISVCKYLNGLGIETRLDSSEYLTHAKVVIFSNNCALVGSSNWNWYSFNTNEEINIFFCSDKVKELEKVFESLWDEGKSCL